MKTMTAGGVVLNKEGKVLVVNQNNDSWSLPKGHVDEGEDPLAAAKREIYEESGIGNVELVRELGSYDRYRIGLDGSDDLSEMKHIIMFLFTTEQVDLLPRDPGNPVAIWMDKEKVICLLTHRKDKEFFEMIKPSLV